jgi:hypothetical protein
MFDGEVELFPEGVTFQFNEADLIVKEYRPIGRVGDCDPTFIDVERVFLREVFIIEGRECSFLFAGEGRGGSPPLDIQIQGCEKAGGGWSASP